MRRSFPPVPPHPFPLPPGEREGQHSWGVFWHIFIITTLFYKIPPHLPLPKGGTIPLFRNPFPVKDRQRGGGGDFQKICIFNYGLLSKYNITVKSLSKEWRRFASSS